jgi:hypothetical protein
MRNRMKDVRDHMVAMMEALASPDATADTVERAKATASLAQVFTNTVKVELEVRKAAGKEHELPEVLQPAELPPPGVRVIEGGRRA